MALLKAIPTEFGFDAAYHHITTVQWTKPNSVNIIVFGFKDKISRDAGDKALMSKEIPAILDDNTLENCYDYLKSLPLFEDSQDV